MDEHSGASNLEPHLTFRTGTLEIQLRPEPVQTVIADTRLDAIVSSDDSLLSMGGGVSAAIASLAGSSIREEVAASLPLPIGTIAVTSAGKLPIKYVLHAVTIDRRSDVLRLPTERTIRQLVREILSRCEALNITRVAIPALATGAARMAASASAEMLARGLRDHALSPTGLKLVVLPIPDRSIYIAFARALAGPPSEEITAVPAAGADVKEARPLRHIVRSLLEPDGPALRAHGNIESLPTTRWSSRGTAVGTAATLKRLTDSDLSRPLLGNRYVVLEELGRGGMAVVHLCWDLVLRRTVAIKILRPDCADPHSLKREAATAFELTHDAIVRLYHFEPARAGHDAYLVMEYLTWPSGEKWIADAGEARLPVRAVQEVGVRMCEALAYAHSRGVLHLDIKPSNVFVDPAGECAKLGDFGLARFSNPAGAVIQVKPAGTPAYMAPEQTTLGARVSSATDVYQMAATLWDFLTGRPPRPPSLDIDGFEPERTRLQSVLCAALAPNPGARPTALQLRQMLRAAAAV